MNPTSPNDERGVEAPDVAGPARPEVLYLVHRLPYPPDKGDRIRAFHLLRSLSKWAEVDLACLADEPPAPGAIEALGRHCRRLAVARVDGAGRWARALGSLALGGSATEGLFRSTALGATVRGWAARARYRAAVASSSSMVPYLRMPGLRDVPAIVDLVDVDSQKWLDYADAGRGPKSWLYRLEGRRLRGLERGLSGWARAVTLVSEAEADLLRRACPGSSPRVIPNGVDLDAFRPAPTPAPGPAGPRCVFVGALDYRPNVDGAIWFCREAWPEVRRRVPGAMLSLVGRRPTPSVLELGREPGVEVVGTVPDVRPYLAAADVAVVPLRIARGVQNKVLEALAMGKAVVASPGALTGLGVEPGVHALSASDVPEWAEALSSLLGDEPLRRQLGARGREYVERHHRWESCLEPLAGLLDLPGAPDPNSPRVGSPRAFSESPRA